MSSTGAAAGDRDQLPEGRRLSSLSARAHRCDGLTVRPSRRFTRLDLPTPDEAEERDRAVRRQVRSQPGDALSGRVRDGVDKDAGRNASHEPDGGGDVVDEIGLH